jgi:head-tail adaptor
MIGKMDQVVEIFTASYVTDDIGGRAETLTTNGQFWSEVVFLTGEEREHAMRDADKDVVAFRFHNYEGFPASTTSVIQWNGNRFDVSEIAYEGSQNLYVVLKGQRGEDI